MSKQIVWLESIVISIASIFAPIKSILITTAVMIIGDLITGIWAAKKRDEPITSAGLRRTISKLIIYELALIFAYLGEHYMSDILPMVKMVSAMISIVELKSIYENLNSISGSDIFKSLIGKLDSANKE